MLVAYLSPLAPAAVLLLGAFILPFVVAWFASRRPAVTGMRYLVAAGVAELAILALLGARLALQVEAPGQGVEILSEWQFSTAETVSALAVQIDELGLPFLVLTLLLLLAAALVAPSLFDDADERSPGDMFSWLALGASACFLFVAANGATLSYAILAFDLFAALYWFRRGHYGLAVARLILGIVTAVELAVATLILASGMLPGGFLLGLILWLRLGGYPFAEANVYRRQQDNNFLIYFVLSLVVTVYLFIRVPFEPWPNLIRWLIVLMMLLNGLLAWLAGSFNLLTGQKGRDVVLAGAETPPVVEADHRPLLLIPLVLAEALLILLAVPVAQGVAVAFAIVLALSTVALWITPSLGRPSLAEKAWIWPYLPAAAACLTLIGLPFTLGWLTRTSIYRSLLLSAGAGTVLIVALANALALSALLRYWAAIGQSGERDGRRSGVAILVMVPFLVPGLGPFILSTLIHRDLATADLDQPAWVLAALAGSVIGAIALDYFRPRIIARLGISPAILTELGYLHWLVPGLVKWADRIGKGLLRAQVIIEGQHYMGWALFIAIVGALIILLS